MAARNPRDLVCARLLAQVGRFPQLDLAPLDTSALEGEDGRDAALAHAIDQAVARRWLSLVGVIQSRLTRPWDSLQPPLKAALLAGAAQLLLLDRLPDHAVINEAVRWAKERAGQGAAGLVNAVLRKVAALRVRMIESAIGAGANLSLQPAAGESALPRDLMPLHDGRAWQLAEPVFAENAISRLAEQTSHPAALLHRWTRAHGSAAAREIALHDLVHPPTLVTGLTQSSAEPGLLAPASLAPHGEAGFFVFGGRRSELISLLATSPGARVQDPSSAAPLAATAGLRPRMIIDLCAGQGTKTRQAAAMHPDARIIATDIDASRCSALRTTFRGHGRVQVIEFDQLRKFDAQADLLVLDVPCSNTGVLARRPEARYRFGMESMKSLIDVQRQIIADAIPLLARPAHLLYATCSIDERENQEMAQWVCKWHRLRPEIERLRLPRAAPGDPPAMYSDGGYFALLSNG